MTGDASPDGGGQAGAVPSPLGRWAARLAALREIVLAVAGIAYVVGYGARAVHAWDNDLGRLPGVQFDYLVAGAMLMLPPAALSLAA